MRANSPQQTPLLQKGMTSGKASGLAQQRRKRRHGASRGRGSVPDVAAILNSTRKEIAMSDKEKVALTKLTSKGG